MEPRAVLGPASPGLGWAQALTNLLMTSCWHLLLKHMFGLSRPFVPPSDLPPRFLTHSLLSQIFKNKSRRPNVSAGSLEGCLQRGWEAMRDRRNHSGRASGAPGAESAVDEMPRWVTANGQGPPLCPCTIKTQPFPQHGSPI